MTQPANPLQILLLAKEIQQLGGNDVEKISGLISERMSRLSDKSFTHDDIAKLVENSLGYCPPDWFITGLRNYIRNCTCEWECDINWKTFNVYIDVFAEESGLVVREK